MARYSVMSLLTVTAFVAVIFSVFNQRRLSKKVAEQATQIERLKKSERLHFRISQVLSNFKIERHESFVEYETVENFNAFAWTVRTIPNATTDSSLNNDLSEFLTYSMVTDVDGVPGGLEILVLHHNSHEVPGSIRTAIALFDDATLVDTVFRSVSTRKETHHVSLADHNSDGKVEAIIDVYPAFGNLEDAPPTERIVYKATKTGLEVRVPITGNKD